MRSFIIIIIIASFFIALTAHADGTFSLKGYVIGAEQNGCPDGALLQHQMPTGETMCNLGPTTLANEPAGDHVVVLKGNKISGVMFKMRNRGRYANRAVVDAFKSKYGAPTEQKVHLNEFIWKQGSLVLSVDGFTGLIILVDVNEARKTKEESAVKNKDDL